MTPGADPADNSNSEDLEEVIKIISHHVIKFDIVAESLDFIIDKEEIRNKKIKVVVDRIGKVFENLIANILS
jgi:hypothetical protein